MPNIVRENEKPGETIIILAKLKEGSTAHLFNFAKLIPLFI